jgi:phospholipid/cholesterol/gamma-HCH transport system substrate-binding protein
MTDRHIRRSAIVGIAVTSILVFLTMSIGGLHVFARSYSIKAEFASASGIQSGDPVRVAGVEVGSVTKVERVERTTNVRATLKLDKGTWLADGTRASIRLRTLLGSRFVSLDTPSTGRRLAAGTIIPVDRTEIPVELDQTLDALSHVAKPFDVRSFNALVGAFAGGLDGHAQQLNAMLGDLAHLSDVMAAKQGDIDTLIAATAKLSTAVDDRREALGTSIDSFAQILGTLAARRQQLSDLVSAVHTLSDRLTPLLAKSQGTVDHALSDLVTTVGVLDEQKDRLDLALGNLPEFARRLVKVSDDGSFVNVYFVGTIPGPYVADPVDLGDAHSNEPGHDGGFPRIWAQPPAQVPNEDVGGTEVRGDDEQPPPPSGYGRRPQS